MNKRRVRLAGIVSGETVNIEVSLDIFEKITKLAISTGDKRFYCTSKIFSKISERGQQITEETVNQYLEEEKAYA